MAKQGKLLKQLHQTTDVEKVFTGTPAKRAQHNGGKRRVGGPVKNSKYSLVEPDFTAQDPYSPRVQFPSTAQERHCGRKRARTTTRGISMDKLEDDAIKTLGSKINKITDSSDNCKPKSKRRRVEKCTTTTKQTEILNFKPTFICISQLSRSHHTKILTKISHLIKKSYFCS